LQREPIRMKSVVHKLQRQTKRYQSLIPRLVEGAFGLSKSVRHEWSLPPFTGHDVRNLVDPNLSIPLGDTLGELVLERIHSLVECGTHTFDDVTIILLEDVERAEVLCAGLNELLVLEEIPFDEKELFRLFRKTVLLAWAGKAEKWWKHQVSWIFARYMQDELPATPTWWYGDKEGFLLGGRFRRLQLFLIHGGWKRMARFADSLLQGIKRVANDVPTDFVTETLEKHRRALTSSRAPPKKAVKTKTIYRSLAKTICEVYPTRRSNKLPVRVPSLRSHIESSRKEGGALKFIVREKRIQISPTLLSIREGSETQLVEIWSRYDPEDLRVALLEYYESSLTLFDVAAAPVALCEPFKVRVITKGEAGAYWVAKGLQGKLWKRMSMHPTFQLVGRPCSEEIVDSFLQKCNPNDWFVSGDYESATDNLDPEITDWAFCYLAQRLGFFPTPQMRASLVHHRLSYGHCLKGESSELDSLPQTWGQLMGSPLSFILLCLINAAASRLALDPELRKPLRALPMLINGDDILMGMSKEQYEVWKGVTAQCGLTYSVGKNYFSSKYLMINSELYRVERVDFFGQEEKMARFIPFINLGLMKGRGRTSYSGRLFGGGEYASDLAGLAHSLVRGHELPMADRLLSRFIEYNRDELDRLPPGMSWFLPRSSGGYGLPLTREPSCSEQQLKVAAYVRTGQGSLRLKHVESDQTLRSLSEEEDTTMMALGAEWIEGGTGDSIGLMRVNWPALEAERDGEGQLKAVVSNFASLRRKALSTSLHPMELINALETVSFGWSRTVNVDLPALKVDMI